jgi:hypothetical protein
MGGGGTEAYTMSVERRCADLLYAWGREANSALSPRALRPGLLLSSRMASRVNARRCKPSTSVGIVTVLVEGRGRDELEDESVEGGIIVSMRLGRFDNGVCSSALTREPTNSAPTRPRTAACVLQFWPLASEILP